MLTQQWAEASQSQLKKIKKIWAGEQRKQEKAKERLDEDARKREENLEKAKSVKITEDTSLPPAKKVNWSMYCFVYRGGLTWTVFMIRN